jgi:transglutaminase-like putative cysteine protease
VRAFVAVVGIVVAPASACVTLEGTAPRPRVADYPTLESDDVPIDPYAHPSGGAAVAWAETAEVTLRGKTIVAIPVATELGDPRGVAQLVVDLRMPNYRVPAAPNQLVGESPDDARAQRVTITGGAGAKVTRSERAAALEATAEFDADHDLVRAVAAEAIAGVDDRADQVAALVHWIDTHITYDFADEVRASTVVTTGRGDCSEQAMVFVALARAVKIPARRVLGLVYSYADGEQPAFGYHAWAEVELDHRWVAVDPTWNEPRADATHVALFTGDTIPTGTELDDIALAVVDVTKTPTGEDDPRVLARDLPVHLSLGPRRTLGRP